MHALAQRERRDRRVVLGGSVDRRRHARTSAAVEAAARVPTLLVARLRRTAVKRRDKSLLSARLLDRGTSERSRKRIAIALVLALALVLVLVLVLVSKVFARSDQRDELLDRRLDRRPRRGLGRARLRVRVEARRDRSRQHVLDFRDRLPVARRARVDAHHRSLLAARVEQTIRLTDDALGLRARDVTDTRNAHHREQRRQTLFDQHARLVALDDRPARSVDGLGCGCPVFAQFVDKLVEMLGDEASDRVVSVTDSSDRARTTFGPRRICLRARLAQRLLGLRALTLADGSPAADFRSS